MKKSFHTYRIGILGGGQLGRMLLQKAADFSMHVRVLDPDPTAPCRHLCDEFVNGSFHDYDTVYAFGKNCDIVTIEIEHVSVEALTQLEKEGVQVYPQPSVIRLVQDKGDQKEFFRRHDIPTADFFLATHRQDLMRAKIQFPVIQKLRTGGYDGRGVMRLNNSDDLSRAFDTPSVVESLIHFRREISVIVARDASGQCLCFPSVEMEFNCEANLVEFLFSPSTLEPPAEAKARTLAERIAVALDLTGILAVEMFETADGEFLVNEIAPRPHNSGHHTIEANVTSQYEQHLRAITGLPLGNTDIISPAAMINLLGEKNYEGLVIYEHLEEALREPGVHVHLYGKKFTRPFRKMGHVTVTAASVVDAKEKARRLSKLLRVIA
jgi:5-(carboxyamino)imidazole ribonucleotide synthase